MNSISCPVHTTIFDYLGCAVLAINNVIIPLIFALAFIFYIYRVYNLFIYNGADPASQKKGREFALWGIVGFFVMLSIWGLVNILINTFSFGNTTPPTLPTFGTSGATTASPATTNSNIVTPYSSTNNFNFSQTPAANTPAAASNQPSSVSPGQTVDSQFNENPQ